jgi:hypothetical protein
MLTRLKVNGFQNLVDVDVRFGPFNCIAGVQDLCRTRHNARYPSGCSRSLQ